MTDNRKKRRLFGSKLVDVILTILNDALARETVSIDLRKNCAAADYIIICEGENVIHNRAIAEKVMERLSLNGTPTWRFEGLREGRWILLDYSDVVVHILLPELREYYNIEGLWPEGKIKRAAAL